MKKSRKTAKMMLKLGRSVTSERQVMKTITLLCWLPAIFCNPKIESTIPICLFWQSWTLYKSTDCRWMSITILCVSLQIQRQSAVLNKSNIAIHGLTNQQTISPASNAQRIVLSWSIVYPELVSYTDFIALAPSCERNKVGVRD